MNKGIKIIAIAVLCALSVTVMTSCSSSKKAQENNSYTEGIKDFAVDNNTAKVDDAINNNGGNTGGEHIFIPSELPEAQVGTIELVGKDLSTDYTIQGDNIVYDGVTYQGLNKAVNSIETPYDKITFTNFIIKTFTPKSDTVFVSYLNEEEETDWQPSTTLDEELLISWDGYSYIRDKYNSVAIWSLSLRDNGGKAADIIGNKDYMLQGSASKDIVVDMSKYDTREDKEDTISNIEDNNSNSESTDTYDENADNSSETDGDSSNSTSPEEDTSSSTENSQSDTTSP